jgi:hypothetical protein
MDPQLLGFAIGLVVAVFLGAAIARVLCKYLGGFTPAYKIALLSTSVAYAIGLGIGFLLRRYASAELLAVERGMQALIGWGVLACVHANLLRGQDGRRLKPFAAILLALLQILGVIVSFIAVLLLMVAVVKVTGR